MLAKLPNKMTSYLSHLLTFHMYTKNQLHKIVIKILNLDLINLIKYYNNRCFNIKTKDVTNFDLITIMIEDVSILKQKMLQILI